VGYGGFFANISYFLTLRRKISEPYQKKLDTKFNVKYIVRGLLICSSGGFLVAILRRS
jgi:hypothetical protein